MILLRKFNNKEILEIISKHACDSLPDKSVGVIDAVFNKKHEIEVYFIESIESSEIPS